MACRAVAMTAAAGALTFPLAACGSSSGTVSAGGKAAEHGATISGAGSTLAAPVYQEWATRLADRGVTLNYQGVGSGAGVASFTTGTVDFAASDPPLNDDEIKAIAGSPPVHVPTVFGAITVSYNLPGVKSGLKLDGETIAAIFQGKITTWKAAPIARLNPDVELPGAPIVVVHRADSSGTTMAFTSFLSASSPTWKSAVGSGKTVAWPTGTGAKGNSGVAASIEQQQGAIGYVEQAYALQNGFTYANVRNAAGAFVGPTLESTSAAGDDVSMGGDLRFTATSSSSPKAYPIVSQTFVLVHADVCEGGLDNSQAHALKTFLDYGLGEGQQIARRLSYAPLPVPLRARARAVVDGLTCDGAPIA